MLRPAVAPETVLASLNPVQRQAVQAIKGPVLVLAGAGSGKTRVIAHRIAWLLGVEGVHPRHVLAVTFTNKAAGEMRRRVEDLVLPAAGGVDFDDLLLLVVRLLETSAEALAWYRTLWSHVLVDEYQDTNRAQYRIIQLLTQEHRNLCVVGDPDQSVYRWRGADLRNILDFEKDYPDCRVVTLEQNYRSTKRILDIASAVIANNTARKDKRLWTDNGEGERASVYRAWDENEEAAFVAQSIRALRREGVEHRDIAVFYRTNAQSRVLEDALRRASVPYLIVGGVRFYERREIKDIVAYLRLVVNPLDDAAFRRAVGAPARGAG